MKKFVSIVSLTLAAAWVAWGFFPFPEGWDPNGYSRVLGLALLSVLFLVPGVASLMLWRQGDVRWNLPASLFVTPVCHLLGTAVPLPGNIALFIVPLCAVVFYGYRALRD